jgi:hypothetical protein
VYANGTAHVLVRSSTFRDNKATFGGGILLNGAAAGGIATSVEQQLAVSWHLDGAKHTLTVRGIHSAQSLVYYDDIWEIMHVNARSGHRFAVSTLPITDGLQVLQALLCKTTIRPNAVSLVR